ncbi:mucin-2, partial [Corchorus capsularis]
NPGHSELSSQPPQTSSTSGSPSSAALPPIIPELVLTSKPVATVNTDSTLAVMLP